MKKAFVLFKLILFLSFFSFAFLGSHCENLLGIQSGSVIGNWELVKMEGNLQDVCLGETVNFQQSQAVLTCPGQSPITRNYTLTNNVLTYSSSSISYDVSFLQVNGISKMLLSGKEIERLLTYDKLN